MSWEYFLQSVDTPKITLTSAVFKLFISLIAGGVVGLNREHNKQAAGFRTHILICVGATLLMMLSIYIPQTYFDFKNGDPGRIAAQVVSGIGFLGAGAIIRLGSNVRGITTAASIWLISAIGLSIGAGLYIISLIAVVIAMFTLVVLDKAEHRWLPQKHLKNIFITFSENNFPETEVHAIFKKARITISNLSIDVQNNTHKYTEISLVVQIPENVAISKLIKEITALPYTTSVKIN